MKTGGNRPEFVKDGLGIPPVPFDALAAAVAPPELKSALDALLVLKRQSGEMGLGAPIPVINYFIEAELARHGTTFSGLGRPELQEGKAVRDELNGIFRAAVAANVSAAA